MVLPVTREAPVQKLLIQSVTLIIQYPPFSLRILGLFVGLLDTFNSTTLTHCRGWSAPTATVYLLESNRETMAHTLLFSLN